MSLIVFANLFNISCLALLLLIAAVVSRWYPALFFRLWMVGYAGGLATLSLEALAQRIGHTPWLVLIEAIATLMATGSFFATARALGDRPVSWRSLLRSVAWATAAFAVMQVLGVPFLVLAAGPLLLQTLSFFWLGAALLRRRQLAGGYRTRWVGVPLILIGMLPFTYPIAHGGPYEWIYFWIAGVLQIMTGAGMIVLLLDGTVTQLEKRNQELLELDRLKSNFLNTVSHELRTPLTAIKGALWLVSEGHVGPLNEAQVDTLGMVRRNADRLIRLINDILDFSKLESKTMNYDLDEADLREVAELAAESCAPLFVPREISLQVELGDQPLLACVDGDKITQVLVNLLSNASKFTASGGHVRMQARQVDDTIQLEVADDGIGIPPELQEKIFTKFFQIDGTDTRQENGTGLGLAICKMIVEEGHQGQIVVHSQPGRGSTFTVTLRAAPALAPA